MAETNPAPREQQRGDPAPQDRVREAAQAVVDVFETPGFDGLLEAVFNLKEELRTPTEHPDLSGLRRALELPTTMSGDMQKLSIRAEIARLENKVDSKCL